MIGYTATRDTAGSASPVGPRLLTLAINEGVVEVTVRDSDPTPPMALDASPRHRPADRW
ncbi:hypothetical protein AB0E08_08950 [Streptomyces sp. NPDC048281]|uniref:hypothetical protein n=1 Tax=Streptomyces sp. NPDC048281 TaxID=3154715 RepID=UPI0034154E9A